MIQYAEPYVKEKNLLQLRLFYFGKGRPQKTEISWIDEKKSYNLVCICDYGVPGSFDQDVYTACMRIWVKQGMPSGRIKLNYSDVARELRLNTPRAWVGNIRKSLQRLAFARYELTECFVQVGKDGKRSPVNTYFSLFDSASLFLYTKGKSKRNSESELIFPDVIRENLEAKYYQYLDMAWYRSLPEGLPRRLYEYLAKRRYHSVEKIFTISEEVLCRWLPVTDTNVTTRRRTLQKIAQALIDVSYLSEYHFDKNKKFCVFTYGKISVPKEILENVPNKKTESDQLTEQANRKLADVPMPVDKEKTIETKTIQLEQVNSNSVHPINQPKYLEAIKWLSQLPYFHQKRKDEIAALPINEVAELYPGIRKRYEELSQSNKKPNPGWVYKAFMQKWQFMDKAEARFAESPSGKKGRQAKELFDSWDAQKQQEFLQTLHRYVVVQMAYPEQEYQDWLSNGNIWHNWAFWLMERLGLIES